MLLNVRSCIFVNPITLSPICTVCVIPYYRLSRRPNTLVLPSHTSFRGQHTLTWSRLPRRNLCKCPVTLKATAYISMVHSALEYASPIWDPYLRRDCDQLERMQRQAARFTCGDYRSRASVTQMLAKLGWRGLEDRRRDLRLTLLFKVIKGHVAVMVETLDLTKADSHTWGESSP